MEKLIESIVRRSHNSESHAVTPNNAKIGGIGMLRETILTSGWRNSQPTSKARSASLGGDFRSVSNGGNFSLVDHTGAKGVSTIYTPKSRHTTLILRQNSETLYCPFTKNNPSK